MMKLLLSLFLVFLVTEAKDKTCPALPDNKFDIDDGDSVFATDDCEDLDEDCAACEDLCEVEKYTNWMTTKCPKTCGFCSERSPMDSLMSGNKCWKRNEKVNGVELKRVVWKTFKDCEEECLKTEGCIGATTSNYHKSKMECVLVGATNDLQCGCNGGCGGSSFFAAQRTCFEASPIGYCEDAWSSCSTYSRMCSCGCACYKNLLSLACQGTCNKCPAKPEVAGETTWETLEGKRMKGKTAAKKLNVDAAKEKCSDLGEACKGVTCKGKKCSVLSTLKSTTSDGKFMSYNLKVGEGSPKLWRDDLQCGKNNPLWTGVPAQCNGNAPHKCCSPYGWCGASPAHCECFDCIDYSKVGNSRLLE